MEDAIRQAYVVERLSLRETAAKLGVSQGTIRYYMRRFKIPTRSRSEALAGENNPMFGRAQSIEARTRISEALCQTNQAPEVRARRSAAVSGDRNPMAGRSHSADSRTKISQRQTARCDDPEIRKALSEQGLKAWQTPGVREHLTMLAKQRTGSRNPFFGRQHTTSTKQQLAQANRGRFQGPLGSNWQGGKTRLSTLIRNSEPGVRWRKDVFARDAFTCTGCGRVGGALQADHIEPLALLIERHQITTLEAAFACGPIWALSNGRTLCVTCHKDTPSFAGKYQKNFRPRKKAV